jgi:hypothetical protein
LTAECIGTTIMHKSVFIGLIVNNIICTLFKPDVLGFS